MKITDTIEIDAPVEQVFSVFADIPNAANQLDAIDEIEMLSEGTVGVDTRWRETRTMFGKQATEEMWIVDFAPHSGYAAEAESRGMHYRTEYHFAPSGEGSTLVTQTFTGKAKSLGAVLMTPMNLLFKRSIQKAFREDLSQLKQYCER